MNLPFMKRPAGNTGRSGPPWSVPLGMTLWTECPTSTSIAMQAVWVVTELFDHPCRSFTMCFRRWVHVCEVGKCVWYKSSSLMFYSCLSVLPVIHGLHTFFSSIMYICPSTHLLWKVFHTCFSPWVLNSSHWLCNCSSAPELHSPYTQVKDSNQSELRYFIVVYSFKHHHFQCAQFSH